MDLPKLTTTDDGVRPSRMIRLVGMAVRMKESLGVIVNGIDQVSIRRQRVLVHIDDFLARRHILEGKGRA